MVQPPGIAERRIGARVLAITEGDITRIRADAIGNAANSALSPGGGVDAAIHRAGGPAILLDLEARYGAMRHCPTGSAVVTAAGKLPAKWVIHAVGPVWHGGVSGEADRLAAAYRSALRLATELGARTLTLPAISCGIYGYPLDRGARIALRTVAAFLAGGTTLERVTFVLFSRTTFDAFRTELTVLPED